jgi:putative oxidoreductase
MKTMGMLGRLLFGGFFIYSGINHFKQKEMMTQVAASKHVPAPDWAVLASGAALIAGGVSMALGVKPKIGAASLLTFLATVSSAMHDYWNDEDPSRRAENRVQFLKNVALGGATLAVAEALER